MKGRHRHMSTCFSLDGTIPKAYRSPCESSEHVPIDIL